MSRRYRFYTVRIIHWWERDPSFVEHRVYRVPLDKGRKPWADRFSEADVQWLGRHWRPRRAGISTDPRPADTYPLLHNGRKARRRG